MYIALYAVNEFEDFRKAELHSLAQLAGISLDDVIPPNHDWSSPLLPLYLDGDSQAVSLLHRSILVKDFYSVWCFGTTMEELCSNIASLPQELTHCYLTAPNALPFRVIVEAVNKKLSQAEKVAIIDKLLDCHLGITAPVSLKAPQVLLCVLLEFHYDKAAGRVLKNSFERAFYGLHVGSGMRGEVLHRYNLADRCFIGNTSMDVGLSFIMANLGLVKSGSLVYDPFVGTGGILLACGHFGGRGLGVEIDFKVAHGIGKSSKATQVWRSAGESLRANYRQYGVESEFIDILVGDSSMSSQLLRPNAWVDAIVTDPPYGLREASRRLAKEARPECPPDASHYPKKAAYDLSDTFTDLIAMAARHLRVGCRLVFWLPMVRSLYTGPSDLPHHPCFTLVHNCEQVLNHRTSRRLLVLEKTVDYCAASGDLRVESSAHLHPGLFRHGYIQKSD